jgi:hypothetical protein
MPERGQHAAQVRHKGGNHKSSVQRRRYCTSGSISKMNEYKALSESRQKRLSRMLPSLCVSSHRSASELAVVVTEHTD